MRIDQNTSKENVEITLSAPGGGCTFGAEACLHSALAMWGSRRSRSVSTRRAQVSVDADRLSPSRSNMGIGAIVTEAWKKTHQTDAPRLMHRCHCLEPARPPPQSPFRAKTPGVPINCLHQKQGRIKTIPSIFCSLPSRACIRSGSMALGGVSLPQCRKQGRWHQKWF